MGARVERLHDVAPADAAFRATADTVDELFSACALATSGLTCDANDASPAEKRAVSISAASLEDLLYDFLSAVVYMMDVEAFVIHSVECQVDETRMTLKAAISGERADPSKHALGVGVKAVTMHKFSVRKIDEGWEATFVVDL